MGKILYRYTVLDKGKVVLEDATLDEASEFTGIPVNNISTYVREGYVFNKRFQVTRQELDSEETKVEVPPYIKKQWEDIQKAVKVIKDGGHIVEKRVKGKVMRYTEASK